MDLAYGAEVELSGREEVNAAGEMGLLDGEKVEREKVGEVRIGEKVEREKVGEMRVGELDAEKRFLEEEQMFGPEMDEGEVVIQIMDEEEEAVAADEEMKDELILLGDEMETDGDEITHEEEEKLLTEKDIDKRVEMGGIVFRESDSEVDLEVELVIGDARSRRRVKRRFREMCMVQEDEVIKKATKLRLMEMVAEVGQRQKNKQLFKKITSIPDSDDDDLELTILQSVSSIHTN